MTVPSAPPLRAGAVLRELLLASRPVSWINTAYPFAAAYLLTTREVDLVFVVGTLFFLIPYNLAMYGINDVFDYESDLRNPRKGGAHGAVLDRRMHPITLWTAGLACAPFLVLLVLVGSPASWLVLGLSMFFVVFYSAPPLRLKERPFADSVTSSIHFFSPAVYALVLAGAVWTWQLYAVLVAFALWGVCLPRVRGGAGCRGRPRRGHLLDRDRARGALDSALRPRLLPRGRCGDARHRLARTARRGARGALPRRGLALPVGHR